MEQIRPLEYTIKIYGEGFTEWFYFDGLRTNNRFRFSMVPEVPKNSRSSYKGLHKEVSILNAYRAGKLGAKPNMGSIFLND